VRASLAKHDIKETDMDFKLERPLPALPLSGFGGQALGSEYGATSRYLTKNGKPFIYRMGEIHYSRVPSETWEEELIKMRDGGINVIASYVFWIHHEECEGEFNFEGDCDLGAFLAVCKRLSLPFVLRIGPWAHGEAKNGGFPDWLIEKCGDALRTDSEPYLSYVRRFFEKIYEQVKDYSDVIVGIQLENELRRQAQYVKKLKNFETKQVKKMQNVARRRRRILKWIVKAALKK
jgi:hypothetical protein